VSGEQAKNSHAREIMMKILDGATWINVHQLPVIVGVFSPYVYTFGLNNKFWKLCSCAHLLNFSTVRTVCF